MTESTRDLLKRALELPPKERAELVRELGASLGDEDLASDELDFAAELERRAAEPPPPGGWPTGKDVLDEARARLREHPTRGG